MDIQLYHGDIIELDVDVLICSANVSLNLSGGVGGALMEKYGAELQTELHSHLPANPSRRPRGSLK
jgi:O-acetyl-ADP-ribose deacetylase (regulator of RNase III)